MDDFINIEGMLLKWTNYFSGWQPRWFILENGILSYYNSHDDVKNGCKGSIKMSVCDVNVHQTDNQRLDFIIPGEAHYYVRAPTPQERQQWLVALGTCKACLADGKPRSLTRGDEPKMDDLKTKKSELRLYCDLLMQQVHSVKDAIDQDGQPDKEKLEQSTSLLRATCDTFIQSLEGCMQLVGGGPSGISYNGTPSPVGSPTEVPSLKRSTSADRRGAGCLSSSYPGSPNKYYVQGYIPTPTSRTQRSVSMTTNALAPRSRTPSSSSEKSFNTTPTGLMQARHKHNSGTLTRTPENEAKTGKGEVKGQLHDDDVGTGEEEKKEEEYRIATFFTSNHAKRPGLKTKF